MHVLQSLTSLHGGVRRARILDVSTVLKPPAEVSGEDDGFERNEGANWSRAACFGLYWGHLQGMSIQKLYTQEDAIRMEGATHCLLKCVCELHCKVFRVRVSC
jgi:hypothetical protein